MWGDVMALHPIPRDRAEWLAMRMDYVTASEAACLFGRQAAWAPSLYALHHIKSRLIAEDDFKDDARMRWGRRLEAFVAIETSAQEGFKFRKGVWATDDTTPGLAATLDFVIPKHPLWTKWDGPGALECKTIDWVVWKRDWDERPTFQIEVQLQAQLAASGFSWGIIAVLVGGNDLQLFYRRADPTVIDELRIRVRTFWRNVERRHPPETDGSDSTADAIAKLYAAPPKIPAVECPSEVLLDARMAAFEFINERAARLAAEKREAAVKNLIKAAMGDGAEMCLPPLEFGDPEYLCTRSKSGVLNVKELAGT